MHTPGGRRSPPYEGSEHFLGFRDNADGSIVDPAAVHYTAERMGQDAKMDEQRTKSANAQPKPAKKSQTQPH